GVVHLAGVRRVHLGRARHLQAHAERRARHRPSAARLLTVVRRAALLLTVVIAAAHDARAAQVDREVEAGALITKRIVTFDSRPTVAAGVTWVWSPLGHLALGLETAVTGTALPVRT